MNITYESTYPPKNEYFRLFESTGWNKEYQLTEAELYKSIENSWYMISAYEERKLVGFGRIISDGMLHALIVDMIVLPSLQRKGVGTAILDQLVSYCKSKQIRDIQLFCAKGKAPFYEKYGFSKRPEDAPGMQIKIIP
ncbi:MAG: GNAT family N-acetyltransferase [Acidobacteria bacterium]|jgi:GNAT superfamily N-acetyltransferase|nr:GNAT family N-acetyltransferase [Acidobacteriota bacterium]